VADSSWLLVLALSAFTSATLLPGSSEATLVGLHLSQVAPGWLLLAVASVANVAGSCVNCLLGRFAALYVGRRWFPATPEQLDRASAWYRRFGWPTLLLSWVPVIGDPLTVMAGIMRTPLWLFLIVVAFAKTSRYAALLWVIDLI
jgi:membrane protein YqaA with SNARE-associated domain